MTGDAGIEDIYRLSPLQEAMLVATLRAPGTGAYVVQISCRLAGPLDAEALRRAWQAVVARHAVLRTSFHWEELEHPLQVVHREVALPWREEDWRGGAAPGDGEEARLAAWLEADRRRGFDPAEAPLLRLALLRLGEDAWRFVLTHHHLLLDGWSQPLLFREVFALYEVERGTAPPVRLPPALPFRDQIDRLRRLDQAAAERFWRRELAGFRAPTPLPWAAPAALRDQSASAVHPDKSAPAAPPGRLVRAIPEPATAALRELAQACRVTLATVVQGAWALLLARTSGEQDVVFGSVVSGRSPDLPGVATRIGPFLNTVPVRVAVPREEALAPWLARLQERQLAAQPFEASALAQVRGWSEVPAGRPLFESILVFENYPLEPALAGGLDGLALSDLRTAQSNLEALTLAVEPGERLTLFLAWDRARATAAGAARLAEHLAALLAGLAGAGPRGLLGELPLLPVWARHQLIHEWAGGWDGGAPGPPETGTIHGLFARRAAERPGAPAVTGPDGATLSYGELAARAHRLARRLRARGAGPGALVGICLPRSPELVAALLAVLQTGAAAVPLDPVHPAARRAALLAGCGAALLVALRETAEEVPATCTALLLDRPEGAASDSEEPEQVPAAWTGSGDAGPGAPAYVIFTSGSTGRPKGVAVPHGNVLRLLAAAASRFDFGPDDVWTLFHSLAFDFSVWEIWGALLHGGRLVVVPQRVTRAPDALLDLLARERVTVLNQTPSAFRQLQEAEGLARAAGRVPDLAALRWVVFGGEALEPAALAPWFERRGDRRPGLVNMYGITETTVHVTERPLARQDAARGASPLGRPLAHLTLHLLDAALAPVPVEVRGEIYVGGGGLALGYVGRPDLTAERFVPDPFGPPGSRLYRSGDLARRRPDGDLDFLGRADHQVKVRGVRIEPGEVEAALALHPAVRQAVVAARGDAAGAGGEARLVAYVVPEGPAPDLPALRAFLSGRLPEPMLPAALVVLAELPLTANGKVDRGALPAPGPPVAAAGTAPADPPRTLLESLVAGLIAGLLGRAEVGRGDGLFTLGGTSIDAVRLANRLQGELGEIVHVVVVFDAATVAALADHLAAEHAAAVERRLGPGAHPPAGEGRAVAASPAVPAAAPGEPAVGPVEAAAFRRLLCPLPPHPPGLQRNPPAVFLLSPPRSGSTLLRVMLAGHPGLFAPPELELLSFDTLRERRAAFSGRDAFWLEGAVRAVMEIRGCGPAEAEAAVAAAEREGLTTHDFYGRLQGWLDGRLLVDKTPSYALDSGALARAESGFRAPRYLHLVRHPHAVIRSFEEARLDQLFFRREHPFTRRQLAELIWTESHRNVLGFLAGVPAARRHTVRFEELVQAPERVLGGICDFLGIPFHPGMADPYRERRGRMTEGPHPESRMLGDVKLLSYSGVDPAVADRWRAEPVAVPLGEPAREIAAALGYGPGPDGQTEQVAVAGKEAAAADPIPAVTERGEAAPLSFAQERLWFLDHLDAGGAAYLLPMALRLAGRLDAAVLERSLAEVACRHAVLRSMFRVEEGRPVQRPWAAPAPGLPRIDLRTLPRERREAEAERLAGEQAALPFDLARGPLLRAVLVLLAGGEGGAGAGELGGEAALLLTLHHIAADGWSLGVLVRELAALYPALAAGRPSPLPAPPLQYADFARWQREHLGGEALAGLLAWWRERLAGAPEALALPADRPRPDRQRFRGAGVEEVLRSEDVAALRVAARGSSGATPFVLLTAALAALLGRTAHADDLLLGTPAAGRDRPELEGLVGFFADNLVLRLDLAGRPSYPELVERVRAALVEALAHQVPFATLVEALQPRRSLSHAPLFQVMLAFQPAPPPAVDLPGLALRPLGSPPEVAKFDLTLVAAEERGTLRLQWRFDAELFDAATVRRLARTFRTLVQGVAAAPASRLADLPLLAPAERHQLLVEWGRGAPPPARWRCFPELFAERAARDPEAVALRLGPVAVTAGELALRAARLARRLRAAGAGPETPVAVLLDRSVEAVTALLAVLAAGAVYLPLDSDHPPARLAWVLADSAAPLLVTRGAAPAALEPCLLQRLAVLDLEVSEEAPGPAPMPADLPAVPVAPESLAYLLYTSGSTGRPKGVLVPHRGLDHLTAEQARRFRIGPGDRVLQFAPPAFDAAVAEILVALRAGAALHLAPREALRPGRELVELLAGERITAVTLPPSALAALPPASLPDLRTLIVAGEACPPETARRWADGRRLLNAYGPTEATVCATVEDWDGEPPLLLGRPLAEVDALVLDRLAPGGAPAPVGVAGELALGGAGLARGYLGRPDLTAERFQPHPAARRPGERLYRTGDLARFRPDGRLEFLGRIDAQVKVRGVRVEPGEVEAALLAHPDVAAAAVVAAPASGGARLVAWIVAREGAEVAEDELRRALARRLPEPLVPARVVRIDALPLTPAGKVDRRALAARNPEAGAGRPARRPPADPVERLVADLYQEVLGVAEIGADDDFFALGGSSVQGAVLLNLLEQRLGEVVYVVALFEAPTVAGLAAYLRRLYPEALARVLGTDEAAAPAAEPAEAPGAAGPAAVELLRRIVPALPARTPPGAGERRNPRAVFLLSPPRSGSTLLRAMLAGHPKLFAPPELELLGFNDLRQRRDALSGRHELWREGLVRAAMEALGCGLDEARQLIAEREERGQPVRELFGELQAWIGGRLLVDKTPSYALDPATLARAEEDFDGPLYLHLLRHPGAVIRSFERARLEQVFFRHPHPFTRRQLAELVWVVSHQNIRGLLAAVPAERRFEVRFEDLVEDPRRVLGEVCAFLGVEADDRLADPYADASRRMLDGVHRLSRMLGDVRFHEHRRVDPEVAGRWREDFRESSLGGPARDLAREMGYAIVAAPGAAAASRAPRIERLLVPLAAGGDRPPLFLIHPVGGDVQCYAALARLLPDGQPVYGLQSAGLAGEEPQERIEEMAERYLQAVETVQPGGPCRLAGWSIGGAIAQEMARRLAGRGREVALLALLDSVPRAPGGPEPDEAELLAALAQDLAGQAGIPLALAAGELRLLPPADRLDEVVRRARAAGVLPADAGVEPLRRRWRVFRANLTAFRRFQPGTYGGRLDLLEAGAPRDGWEPLAGHVERRRLAAGHFALLRRPAVHEVARWLAERLAAAVPGAHAPG